jgi:hypothetical protein
VPRPKIIWKANEPTIGCSAQEVRIPVTPTGFRQFEIAYSINYYDNYDGSGTPVASTSDYLVLTNDILIFPANAFDSGLGLYEITITGITDRISRKSLDMSLVASQPGDLPPDAHQVFLYPSPKTNPLKHVRNMP